MAGRLTLAIGALTAVMLIVSPAQADSPKRSFSFTPHYLKVDGKKNEQNQLQEAKLGSGLGLKLDSELLQFNMDYKVLIQLKDQADDADLSQKVGAVFYSNALNRLLGLKADVRAGSTIKQAGDAYVHSITPGFSKSFSDLATLSVRYQYSLDQANARAMEKEKSGYRMGLSGKSQDGRLTWKGNYGSTEVFGGNWQLQSIEFLEFESRYQLVTDLRLELSARSKNETRYDTGLASDFYTETRYGAGLAWSPSEYYSMALKVNRLRESRTNQQEIFGSGVLSWFPRRELELTFSYGDHLIDGDRAFMLGTRIDLNGS